MPLFGNRSIIAQPVDLWTLTERYVDFGIDFVQSATAAGDKPWFLYQAFNHMHVPVTSASAFFNTSTSRNKLEHGHVYGDALRELDHHIGRILDELDSLGVRNNTLIVFTGDNGGKSSLLACLLACINFCLRGPAHPVGILVTDSCSFVVVLAGPSDQCEYGGSNHIYNGTWLRLYGGGGGTGKTTTW